MAGARGPLVVMGVSGAGKTTVGERLAAVLGVEYADGDAFHPAANVAKMSAGVPLDDADRWPWLDAVGDWLARRPGGVVSCSALKRSYRDRLRSAAPGVFFLELDVPRAELVRRLTTRSGHFMRVRMLDSQLSILEPLAADESGARIDAGGAIGEVVERARVAVPPDG
ncbi:gluconokinase [Nocardia blacklockiae]|uniref:gluconokinase n=1 Tax=Nocardia blacklockiae TaxID=480036 RepID=UPI001894AFDE|nr:gluconokinase [Nocardia blacklockiae]MBF6175735.1 gluconokinase [Nocardia blacklockiae]